MSDINRLFLCELGQICPSFSPKGLFNKGYYSIFLIHRFIFYQP